MENGKWKRLDVFLRRESRFDKEDPHVRKFFVQEISKRENFNRVCRTCVTRKCRTSYKVCNCCSFFLLTLRYKYVCM